MNTVQATIDEVLRIFNNCFKRCNPQLKLNVNFIRYNATEAPAVDKMLGPSKDKRTYKVKFECNYVPTANDKTHILGKATSKHGATCSPANMTAIKAGSCEWGLLYAHEIGFHIIAKNEGADPSTGHSPINGYVDSTTPKGDCTEFFSPAACGKICKEFGSNPMRE